MKSSQQIEWSAILIEAVTKPGLISEAYSRFWNYSTGNQILAMMQCAIRSIKAGPIHTFNGWKELGRFVKKGEKAIELCMPITCKKTVTAYNDATGQDDEKPVSFARFTFRRNWFVLSQTDGSEYEPVSAPEWSESTALAALNISRVPFELTNGNCQGYATGRSIAVSSIAAMPHKTLFHELAHVLLGHTEEGAMNDGELTPQTLREAEAESVAMIVCESLGLPGAEYCRGYIQGWLKGQPIPESSTRIIFTTASTILKAGRPADAKEN
jgi:antirestriction protein ArdC